jgi:hypothetical protein
MVHKLRRIAPDSSMDDGSWLLEHGRKSLGEKDNREEDDGQVNRHFLLDLDEHQLDFQPKNWRKNS